MFNKIKIVALIPAAGIGSRMHSEIPKQYIKIHEKPIIFYSLKTLINCPQIDKIFLVLSPNDEIFATLNLANYLDFSKVAVVKIGGKTRAESVFNALQYLQKQYLSNFHENSKIFFSLIHDAARPLLNPQVLQNFIQQILDFYHKNPTKNIGGLLALPLADTLKLSQNQQVIKTIPRENLFLAQTPQMFLLDILLNALQNCDFENCTDEASAIEKMNYQPLLVKGDRSNFKITYPNDLNLAEILLKSNYS